MKKLINDFKVNYPERYAIKCNEEDYKLYNWIREHVKLCNESQKLIHEVKDIMNPKVTANNEKLRVVKNELWKLYLELNDFTPNMIAQFDKMDHTAYGLFFTNIAYPLSVKLGACLNPDTYDPEAKGRPQLEKILTEFKEVYGYK
jgi:hypothetical protein